MSGERTRRLSGMRKAAILVVMLGHEVASAIYRNLSEEEVERLTREVADVNSVSPEIADQVLQEYHQLAVTQEYVAQGGMEYASQVLVKAFGEEPAKLLIQRVVRAQELSASKLDSLQKVDPQQLAKFIEEEHPQTIAVILAHLDTKQASSLLMKLPASTRADVVKRLARLRQFSPEMAEKVSIVLNRRLQALGEQSRKTYSGFQGVADLMNRMDSDASREILENIEQDEPKLALEIRNLMFTFEDLIGIPEQSLSEWVSSLDKKTLAMALKGATEELKSHVFRTMSSRAVQMLTEDMEAMGPVRAKDIAAAKQEAVAMARKLEAEGKLALRAEGDDEYVL